MLLYATYSLINVVVRHVQPNQCCTRRASGPTHYTWPRQLHPVLKNQGRPTAHSLGVVDVRDLPAVDDFPELIVVLGHVGAVLRHLVVGGVAVGVAAHAAYLLEERVGQRDGARCVAVKAHLEAEVGDEAHDDAFVRHREARVIEVGGHELTVHLRSAGERSWGEGERRRAATGPPSGSNGGRGVAIGQGSNRTAVREQWGGRGAAIGWGDRGRAATGQPLGSNGGHGAAIGRGEGHGAATGQPSGSNGGRGAAIGRGERRRATTGQPSGSNGGRGAAIEQGSNRTAVREQWGERRRAATGQPSGSNGGRGAAIGRGAGRQQDSRKGVAMGAQVSYRMGGQGGNLTMCGTAWRQLPCKTTGYRATAAL